jgi:microcystin-dependent protein
MARTYRHKLAQLCALIGIAALPGQASAQASKFIADIFMSGTGTCPAGSLRTDGQVLPISSNNALFSLIGATFGGNGRSTFALPDLRGRSPVGAGSQEGAERIRVGDQGGAERVSLRPEHLPAHRHEGAGAAASPHTHEVDGHTHTGALVASTGAINANSPSGSSIAVYPAGLNIYGTGPLSAPGFADGSVTVTQHGEQDSGNPVASATEAAGDGESVRTRSPYQAVTFCIVTEGIYPQRR